ncbi:flagellin, partial [Eubacteriales bacterium OttesenSCG-928-N14]|nr:flagellin [Eubacteriales bacterium OttesenSCG-928-N14]
MRITNNIMAMNTHRQYGINNAAVAKSTEKLSSGYRVNRAGDDAAGLAISEKMRAQIRGLTMASKNSQDAVSLVQTAEGALQETHSILQRMRELAVQSASDTNEETIDRAALNAEYQQLIAEIDDTAAKTKFNTMGIIDGTFSSDAGGFTGVGAAVSLDATNVTGVADGTQYTVEFTSTNSTAQTVNTAGGAIDGFDFGSGSITDHLASGTSYGGLTGASIGNLVGFDAMTETTSNGKGFTNVVVTATSISFDFEGESFTSDTAFDLTTATAVPSTISFKNGDSSKT